MAAFEIKHVLKATRNSQWEGPFFQLEFSKTADTRGASQYGHVIVSSCKTKCHYLEEHPCHWIGIKVSVVAVSYSTGALSTSTITEKSRHPTLVRLAARNNSEILWVKVSSEGGMIRLETLIELKFVNSSFSSLSSCRN